MKIGLWLGLLIVPAMPACSEKQCPTIDCVPILTATYARAIPDPYRLTVLFNGTSFAANCPMAVTDLGLTPGIQSCDAHQFVVTGHDLGHRDDTFVGVTVTINNGVPLSTGADLRGIANSLDCPLVCFEHAAIIPN